MPKVVNLRRTPADVLEEVQKKADEIESFAIVVIQKDGHTYAQWSANITELALMAICLNKSISDEL